MDPRFSDIIHLIQQSRNNAIRAVNIELVNLYWGISNKSVKRYGLGVIFSV